MVTQDPRWASLQATFAVELAAVAAECARLLPAGAATGGPTADDLDALYRQVYGLAGAARVVEQTDVEALAAALAGALNAGRAPGATRTNDWSQAVRGGAALLDSLLGAVRTQTASPAGLSEAVARLRSLAAPLPAGPPPRPTASAPAPPVSVPAAEAAPARAAQATESVRVAVGKLDALLAQSGELAVTHIRIEQRLTELRELRQNLLNWRREWRATRGLRTSLRRGATANGRTSSFSTSEVESLLAFVDRAEQRAQAVLQRVEEIAQQLVRDTSQLGAVTHSIEDEVMAVRLLPVSTTFGPLERMVRDLTRQTGKEARLELRGGTTEIDRKILEQLRDPLMHMLRNSVDHGIEPPDARERLGKPRMGSVRLSAVQRGGAIEIELEDDGAGLDAERIRASALRKGLLTPDQAARMDDASSIDLIFLPGFSTAASVSELSGRGVGMDVVRKNVESLNGHIQVQSSLGRGTRFVISVPLTLATTRAILVDQTDQLFAIPSATIERTARVRMEQLIHLEGRWTVPILGHPVPAVELADVLERPRGHFDPRESQGMRPYVVLHQGDRRVALLTDRLVGEQEVVIKSLSWPLRRVRNVGGATVLGSGQTVVILNPSDLLKSALRLVSTGVQPTMAPAREQAAARKNGSQRRRVLVVDDSLTTRTMERSILEAAGFEVYVAADGVEALNVLRTRMVDLVVADIQMPRMDGFVLTAEIRRDEHLKKIPVVLVTSLGEPEHRERGVEAGADAYIVKSGFDQGELLATIDRLL